MNGSLYLFPADTFATPPELPFVLELLTKNGLAGRALDNNRYMTGDNFFRHVSFAGCSPSLQLEPPEDGSAAFTHIRLLGPFPLPELFTTQHHSRPRCPHCRQRLRDWKSSLQYWHENPSAEYLCSGCHRASKAVSLDWGRYAASGRLLVEICQVYPGEAVPSDGLMAELKAATGSEWRYGWAANKFD